MAVQQGKGHVYGLSTGTISFKNPDGTSLSGYVSPNLQSLRAVHEGALEEIKDQTGEYSGLIVKGEKVTCEFNFIPEGTTLANAALAAEMPKLGSSATIANLQVIIFGSFSDVFNASSWFYLGGGTNNPQSDSHWTASFTLHRYPGITTTTQIS